MKQEISKEELFGIVRAKSSSCKGFSVLCLHELVCAASSMTIEYNPVCCELWTARAGLWVFQGSLRCLINKRSASLDRRDFSMVVTDGLHSVPILGDLLYIAAHSIDKLQLISHHKSANQPRHAITRAKQNGIAKLS